MKVSLAVSLSILACRASHTPFHHHLFTIEKSENVARSQLEWTPNFIRCPLECSAFQQALRCVTAACFCTDVVSAGFMSCMICSVKLDEYHTLDIMQSAQESQEDFEQQCQSKGFFLTPLVVSAGGVTATREFTDWAPVHTSTSTVYSLATSSGEGAFGNTINLSVGAGTLTVASTIDVPVALGGGASSSSATQTIFFSSPLPTSTPNQANGGSSRMPLGAMFMVSVSAGMGVLLCL